MRGSAAGRSEGPTPLLFLDKPSSDQHFDSHWLLLSYFIFGRQWGTGWRCIGCEIPSGRHPGYVAIRTFLFQFSDSSLDGFKGLAHGVGIGPEHLHFIGFAYRVPGAIGLLDRDIQLGRPKAVTTAPSESASESHSSAIAITAAVSRRVGCDTCTPADSPATAGHGTGPHRAASV
jgi:hypothetical protein